MDEMKINKPKLPAEKPNVSAPSSPPGGVNQVGVTVFADLKSGGIVLNVNNQVAVWLSLKGARDLALLLRQKANLVERRLS